MLYVILSYLFSPLIYLLIYLKRNERIKNILIIQVDKIGDLICSTPIFREIKIKYPDSCLNVIINPVTRELLECNHYVDKSIIIDREQYRGVLGKLRLINLIRNGNYDVAISLNPNIPFAIALFWGLVPVRLTVKPNFCGLTFKLASVFLTYSEQHLPGKLTIESYLKLLEKIDIKSSNLAKEVYKSKSADHVAQNILGKINKPLIGITVTSGKKLKELGADKVVELINFILDKIDTYIVLIGSNKDVAISDKVFMSVNHKNKVINTTGKVNLRELPAVIERLSLLIGVDTGVVYMADALYIPVVDIAGPANMDDQRPTGKDSIIIKKEIDCAPCSHAFKTPSTCKTGTQECIRSVSTLEIFNAVNSLLKHNK